MVVVPIDQRDLGICAGEAARGLQAGKAGANDEDPGAQFNRPPSHRRRTRVPASRNLAVRQSFSCSRAGRKIVRCMAKHEPELSLLFHALADPTRRSILTRLAEGPAPVTELANPTRLRLPTVMRHLSVLEEAGLIATSKDGRVRTCAIVPEALAQVRTWLDEQRTIWEARLDRLDDYVMKLMKDSTQ